MRSLCAVLFFVTLTARLSAAEIPWPKLPERGGTYVISYAQGFPVGRFEPGKGAGSPKGKQGSASSLTTQP